MTKFKTLDDDYKAKAKKLTDLRAEANELEQRISNGEDTPQLRERAANIAKGLSRAADEYKAAETAFSDAMLDAVKRGARPYSPMVTAAVSSVATQPAPISMSPWKPTEGTPIRCRSRTPRLISARIAAMAQPL